MTSGRPLLAIRTSCVAFDTNKDQITDANNHVLEQWKEFDRDILGGNYHGHLKEGTDIALVSGMENHPLLRDVKPFNSLNWLYQCAPLRSDKAQVLQTGSNPDKPPEPVFWLNGNNVISTSLGHWDDWKIESFRNLMFNSIHYLLKESSTSQTITNTNHHTNKMTYRVLDFTKIEGVPCPCGIARRGLIDEPSFPGTIHRTDIDQTAKPHYHKKLTEIYSVISCEPESLMQLNDEQIPLHEDMAFYIPPGMVHQFIGKAQTYIVVLPKYDPNDEYLCEPK